jgi:hypothetical protein
VVKAIRICQNSVTDRLIQDGYSAVRFEQTISDDSPGRNDWLLAWSRENGDSAPSGFRSLAPSTSVRAEFARLMYAFAGGRKMCSVFT